MFYIICWTETRLGDLEQEDAVFLKYTSYYSVRVRRRGEEAEVFILTAIISEPMTILPVNLPHIETVFFEVNLPNKTDIVSSI